MDKKSHIVHVDSIECALGAHPSSNQSCRSVIDLSQPLERRKSLICFNLVILKDDVKLRFKHDKYVSCT